MVNASRCIDILKFQLSVGTPHILEILEQSGTLHEARWVTPLQTCHLKKQFRESVVLRAKFQLFNVNVARAGKDYQEHQESSKIAKALPEMYQNFNSSEYSSMHIYFEFLGAASIEKVAFSGAVGQST